jgi:hypothetical protein
MADLDRRRPEGEDAHPAVLGIALEIARNVDVQRAHQPGDLAVALGADIDEALETLRQAPAIGVAGIAAEGQRRDLETRPVMSLEQPGHQMRGGVVVEIGGKIGEADTTVPIPPALPERR